MNRKMTKGHFSVSFNVPYAFLYQTKNIRNNRETHFIYKAPNHHSRCLSALYITKERPCDSTEKNPDEPYEHELGDSGKDKLLFHRKKPPGVQSQLFVKIKCRTYCRLWEVLVSLCSVSARHPSAIETLLLWQHWESDSYIWSLFFSVRAPKRLTAHLLARLSVLLLQYWSEFN